MHCITDATAFMSVLQVVEDVAHDAAEQAQPTADAAKQQVDAAAETVEKQVTELPCGRYSHENCSRCNDAVGRCTTEKSGS